MQITVCPPSAAHSVLASDPAFLRLAHPVAAHFDAHGEVVSTGISFSDYDRMQTFTRKAARREIPDFVLDPARLRAVIVRAVEVRAGLMKQQAGSLSERLKRAEAKLLATRDRKIAVLESLCSRYVAARAAGEPCAKLASEIENLDTQIATLDRPAALIASILFLSYRVGLDSVGVSQHLNGAVKPCAVRQTLARCRSLAHHELGYKS